MVRPQPSPPARPQVKHALCQDLSRANISSILYTLLLQTGHFGEDVVAKAGRLTETFGTEGVFVGLSTVDLAAGFSTTGTGLGLGLEVTGSGFVVAAVVEAEGVAEVEVLKLADPYPYPLALKFLL